MAALGVFYAASLVSDGLGGVPSCGGGRWYAVLIGACVAWAFGLAGLATAAGALPSRPPRRRWPLEAAVSLLACFVGFVLWIVAIGWEC